MGVYHTIWLMFGLDLEYNKVLEVSPNFKELSEKYQLGEPRVGNRRVVIDSMGGKYIRIGYELASQDQYFEKDEVTITPEILMEVLGDPIEWIEELFPTPEGKEYLHTNRFNLLFFTEYS